MAKMKEFGAQLQVTLQSRGLSEVPPKIVAANKQFPGEARVRKLEAGGGGEPPDKPPPDKLSSAADSGVDGRRGGTYLLPSRGGVYPTGPGSDATWRGGRDGMRSDVLRKGRNDGTGYAA